MFSAICSVQLQFVFIAAATPYDLKVDRMKRTTRLALKLRIVDPFITKQARQLSKLGDLGRQLSDEVNSCHSAATRAVQQSNGLGVYTTQGIDWCLGVRSYDLL